MDIALPIQIADTIEVFTYADLVYRLLERRGLAGSARELIQLQVAVQDAYRQLPMMYKWRHYTRRIVITTEDHESYTDAAYNATTRRITLSTGTWPANAAKGEVIYGNNRYRIALRISDTVVELSLADRPTEDFTDDITWIRSSYDLPYQIERVHSVIVESQAAELNYVDPVEMVRQKRRWIGDAANSLVYTVRPSTYTAGQMEVELAPIPATASRVEIVATIRPKPLQTFELTGTDGVTTSGGATFTSAGASFTDAVERAILRISASATLPKALSQYDAARVAYKRQVFIQDRTDANNLVTAANATETVANKGWTISDYIDIEPTHMLPVLEALSFKKFCQNVAAVSTMLPAASAQFEEAFAWAKAKASQYTSEIESPMTYDWYDKASEQPNVYPFGEP